MQTLFTAPENYVSPQRLWQLERLHAGYCQECGAEAREVREFADGSTRRLTLGAECRKRQNTAQALRAARQQKVHRKEAKEAKGSH